MCGTSNQRPDPNIPQDPGIPGSKVPEELPQQEEPHADEVPDTGPPDTDNEGHMTPSRNSTERTRISGDCT